MTRRERMENRLAKREEWAAGRLAKADALLRRNEPFRGDIAFNTQPGHIPERARAIRRSEKAGEHYGMAKRHEEVAATLADRLDSTVFSDDADAVEQLEERIAEREAERDRKKAANAAWRKAGKPAPTAGADAWAPVVAIAGAELAAQAIRSLAHQGRTDSGQWVPYSWAKPFDLTNIGARIRTDQQRIEEVKRQQQHAAQAEAAGGVTIARHPSGWCVVVFAEKPEREILQALRGAGYRWSCGQWQGRAENLPACVGALEAGQGPTEPEEPAEADPAIYACPDGAACTDPECVAENRARGAAATLAAQQELIIMLMETVIGVSYLNADGAVALILDEMETPLP